MAPVRRVRADKPVVANDVSDTWLAITATGAERVGQGLAIKWLELPEFRNNGAHGVLNRPGNRGGWLV